MIGWKHTTGALEKLERLLICKICHNLVKEPCSLEACDHYFCRQCVVNVVGVSNRCPECGSFAWIKDLKPNRQLTNLVSLCKTMQNTIGSQKTTSTKQDDDGNQNGSEKVIESVVIYDNGIKNSFSSSHSYIQNGAVINECRRNENDRNNSFNDYSVNYIELKKETFSCQSESVDNNHQINNSFDSSSSQETDHSTLSSSFELFGTNSDNYCCSESRASPCEHITDDAGLNSLAIGDHTAANKCHNNEDINGIHNNSFGFKCSKKISSPSRHQKDDANFDSHVTEQLDKTPENKHGSRPSCKAQTSPCTACCFGRKFDLCQSTRKGQDINNGINNESKLLKESFRNENRFGASTCTCKCHTRSCSSVCSVGKVKSCECEGKSTGLAIKEKARALSNDSLWNNNSDVSTCQISKKSNSKEVKQQKRKLSDCETDHTQSNDISSIDISRSKHHSESMKLNNNSNSSSKKIKKANEAELSEEIQNRCVSTPIRKKSVALRLENGVKCTPSPSNKLMLSPSSLMMLSPAQLAKKNKRGEGMLHVAAIKGNTENVKCLLEKGANPNDRDNAGWSPLHEACNHGHTAIAKMLLDYGAVIDLPGGQNHDTPLHDAVSNGRVETVKLLVQQGAPLTARNKQGMTPLDYAVTEEMRNILKSSESPDRKIPAAQKELKYLDLNQQQTPKVILCSGLKPEQKAALEKCTIINGGKCVKEFSSNVTHLVTATNDTGHCARTIKYLSALLSGKWIVSFSWITKCLSVKSWVDECQYEVKGTSKGKQDVTRYSRINAEKQLPGLFDGCQFYFNGIFDPQTPNKDTLIQLAKYGGGKVLTREPKSQSDYKLFLPTKDKTRMPLADLPVVAYHAKADSEQYRCTRYIIYDPLSQSKPIHKYEQLSVVPVSWFLDCISNFEIVDISQ